MISTTPADICTASDALNYRAVADKVLKAVYALPSMLEGVAYDAFEELKKSTDLPEDADYIEWLCGYFTIEEQIQSKLESVAVTIAERKLTELRIKIKELRAAVYSLAYFAGIYPPRIPPAKQNTLGFEIPPTCMPEMFIDAMRATPPSSHHAALVHLMAGYIGGLEQAFGRWKASPGNLERQRVTDIAQAWVDAFDRIKWQRQWRLSLAYESRLSKPPEAVFLGSGRYEVGGLIITICDGNQANTLQALVELRTASMAELKLKSGASNPCAELSKLKTKYPLLSPYIYLPGGKGKGGYRTTIRDGR